MHALAADRVATELHCNSPTKLETIHTILIRNSSKRHILTLERVFIREHTFPHFYGSMNEVDPATDTRQASMIVDILQGARNLAVLELPYFHALLLAVPQCTQALLSLDHLTVLKLRDIGDIAFNILRKLRWRYQLATFYVVHTPFPYRRSEDNFMITARGLIHFLSAFPKLHRLEMFWTKMRDPVPLESFKNSFPSIGEVNLISVSDSLIPLVNLCPGVVAVELIGCLSDILWPDEEPVCTRPLSTVLP